MKTLSLKKRASKKRASWFLKYKEQMALMLLLLTVFIQAKAGTDEMFQDTVDFWLNALQGTIGKIILLVAGAVVAITCLAGQYKAVFMLLFIYAIIMLILPALLGSLTATIPMVM